MYMYQWNRPKSHTDPLGLQAVACHGPIAVHAEFLAPWSWLVMARTNDWSLAILGYPMTGSKILCTLGETHKLMWNGAMVFPGK